MKIFILLLIFSIILIILILINCSPTQKLQKILRNGKYINTNNHAKNTWKL